MDKSFNFIIVYLLLGYSLAQVAKTPEVKVSSKPNPPNITFQLLQTSQYFFVPIGSFLQFSLGNWQTGQSGAYLQYVVISYNITVLSTNPNYNFIIIEATNANPLSTSQFNCYVRAVNQGVTQLMNSSNPTGKCANQISSLQPPFNSRMFMNCTDLSLQFNITLFATGQNDLDGSLLFIVDNSGLFPNVSQPTELYEVITNMDEGDRAKFYLFCGLTSIVIIILIILAAVLNCRIRRVDNFIEEERKEKST